MIGEDKSLILKYLYYNRYKDEKTAIALSIMQEDLDISSDRLEDVLASLVEESLVIGKTQKIYIQKKGLVWYEENIIKPLKNKSLNRVTISAEDCILLSDLVLSKLETGFPVNIFSLLEVNILQRKYDHFDDDTHTRLATVLTNESSIVETVREFLLENGYIEPYNIPLKRDILTPRGKSARDLGGHLQYKEFKEKLIGKNKTQTLQNRSYEKNIINPKTQNDVTIGNNSNADEISPQKFYLENKIDINITKEDSIKKAILPLLIAVVFAMLAFYLIRVIFVSPNIQVPAHK
jgi:hypothetical protein